jgi:hypothetical protein
MITIEQTKSANLDAIFAELAALRTENKALRAKLPKNKRHSSTIKRAVVDAHAILCRAFSGDATGCVAMQGEGMSKQRWAWAVAMLRYAGVVAYRQKQWRRGLDFIVTDLAEAISQLEVAGETLNTPDGYRRLRGLLRKV